MKQTKKFKNLTTRILESVAQTRRAIVEQEEEDTGVKIMEAVDAYLKDDEGVIKFAAISCTIVQENSVEGDQETGTYLDIGEMDIHYDKNFDRSVTALIQIVRDCCSDMTNMTDDQIIDKLVELFKEPTMYVESDIVVYSEFNDTNKKYKSDDFENLESEYDRSDVAEEMFIPYAIDEKTNMLVIDPAMMRDIEEQLIEELAEGYDAEIENNKMERELDRRDQPYDLD